MSTATETAAAKSMWGITKRQCDAILKRKQQKELRLACEVVERYARTIGKDCQIVFADTFVEVAPLSWAGSETAPTLFKALTNARRATE